ncbi:helix-turn-helix transcriptional regulator [Nonomuraea wenchangensis]|uniref:helix-turn-helix transcriptional regulator n=1 Tax=Nonomuraea wenchangensis TaxID=568860 RepID=UPI00331AAC28
MARTRRSTRRTAARTKASSSIGSSSDEEWLTLDEVCTKLKVSRRTWDRWQERGQAPRSIRLPGNGPYRIRPEWLQEWLDNQEQA